MSTSSGSGAAAEAAAAAASRAQTRARADLVFAMLGIAMWLGLAIKCWPLFTPSQNIQAALGWISMLVVSILWPALATRHYLAWRTPALAALQLFLFALPFNFSTAVFDVIAPHPGAGWLAWVYNAFQLAMAIRIALLTFTCLGWRLPLRVQMPVQAAKVAMLVAFGTVPYCQSKLLRSPEMEELFWTLHRLLALLGTPLMPLTPAAAVIPADSFSRRAAVLLLSWLLLGWLMPCLLLLPGAPRDPQRPQPRAPQRPANDWEEDADDSKGGPLEGAAKAALRLLLLPPAAARAAAQPDDWPAGLVVALRWWVLVQLSWGAACAVAPLFTPGGEP